MDAPRIPSTKPGSMPAARPGNASAGGQARVDSGANGGAVRQTGTVVRFETSRGFGFIHPDHGGRDLFFHVRSWTSKVDPEVGMKIEFDVRQGDRGPEAADVCRPEDQTLTKVFVWVNRHGQLVWGDRWIWLTGERKPIIGGPADDDTVKDPQVTPGVWEAKLAGSGRRWSARFVRKIEDEPTMMVEAEAVSRSENGGFLSWEVEAEYKAAKERAKLRSWPDGHDWIWYLWFAREHPGMTRTELATRLDQDIAAALARKAALVTTISDATQAQSTWWYFRRQSRSYGDHVKASPKATESDVHAFVVALLNGEEPETLRAGYVDEEREGGDTQGGGHWVD